MTTPEPSEPTANPVPETPVTEDPVVTEPVTTEDQVTAEDASDAALRAWAKDNDVEGVPGSGKLSAAWREQLTNDMAAALDPKVEASAETVSPESSTSETMTEEPAVEYRSVFEPPETWVSSQHFTA